MTRTRWSWLLRRDVPEAVHVAAVAERIERYRRSLARYLRDLDIARTPERRAQVTHNLTRVEREIRYLLQDIGAIEVSNRPAR